MNAPKLEILYPGIFTTVQDLGRKGYLAAGIPPSGAMDSFALKMGNLLLKNPMGEAGIEMTGYGLKAKVSQDAVVAITGGEARVKVNDEDMPLWQSVKVKTGDVITVAEIHNGFRSYLCVAGGIDVPSVLGSKSTYAMGKMGGFRGRPLKKNDLLNFGNPKDALDSLAGRRVDPQLLGDYREVKEQSELRVVLGPQDDHVMADTVEKFLSSVYTTSIHCNRVGYRFEGPQIFFKKREKAKAAGSDPSNIVDDGNAIGAIQVPGGKEPICLGPDGVSMGGYVKIACLIAADMDKMAQIGTGKNVRFKSVTVDEARDIIVRSLERVNEKYIY